jgi:hypothetical protein
LSHSFRTGAADRRNHSARIIWEAQQGLQCAITVGSDAEMETLISAIKSGNIKKIVTAISEAKQIAAGKLTTGRI